MACYGDSFTFFIMSLRLQVRFRKNIEPLHSLVVSVRQEGQISSVLPFWSRLPISLPVCPKHVCSCRYWDW
jgi:hypothetical protein